MKYVELEKAKTKLERLIMDVNHDEEPVEIVTNNNENAVLVSSKQWNEINEALNSYIEISSSNQKEENYSYEEYLKDNYETGSYHESNEKEEYKESYDSEEWFN